MTLLRCKRSSQDCSSSSEWPVRRKSGNIAIDGRCQSRLIPMEVGEQGDHSNIGLVKSVTAFRRRLQPPSDFYPVCPDCNIGETFV